MEPTDSPHAADREVVSEAADATSVRFSIEVQAAIEVAFRVFTEGIDTWWPRDHRIGRAEMAQAILEPRVGGRWYELSVDGTECDWGIVLAWEPPRHVALSWRLDGDFRAAPAGAPASRVDIGFAVVGDQSTRVVLEHSGLDRHGPTWPRLREGISRGWPADLRHFATAAASAHDRPLRPSPSLDTYVRDS